MIARRGLSIGLVAAVGFATAAEANWSRPVTVGQASEPHLALSASPGLGAALSWIDDDPRVVTARRIGRRGGLGPTRVLSPPLDDLSVSPEVAMDALGRIVASW
jgi:hypothetical protein